MNIGYQIGSIIIFVLLIGWFGYICITLIRRYKQGSASFADFIKDFKKGRWTPLYVLAYPLFCMNFAFMGKSIADCFLWGLTYTIKLLTLNFDVNLPLMEANVWFKAAILTANILAVLNLLLFAYSCLRQIAWKWYHILRYRHSHKEKSLIIGDSRHNETILVSAWKRGVRSLLLRILNKDQSYSLFANKKPYIDCFNAKDFEEKIEDQIDRLFKNHKRNLRIEKELSPKEDIRDQLNISLNLLKDFIERQNKTVYKVVVIELKKSFNKLNKIFSGLEKELSPEESIWNQLKTILNEINPILDKEQEIDPNDESLLNKNYSELNKILAILDNEVANLKKQSAAIFWKTRFIINFENENNNIKYCDYIIKLINKYASKKISNHLIKYIWPYLDIYVYSSDASENIYKKLIQDSNGSITLLNKYELISRELITNYPLVKYLNENHIDFNTSLVKPGTNINVFFVGFGKTAKNAFIGMFWNNQLVTKNKKGKIVNHNVNYHFFDKNKVINDKLFNYDFLRYTNEFLPFAKQKEYLPILDSLVEYKLHPIDIYNESFFNEFNKSLSKDKQSLNYVVVSLGDDFQSLEAANLIQQKVSQWSKEKNTLIFVHVSSKEITKLRDIQNSEKPNVEIITPFGFDDETVYSYEKIVDDLYTNMCIIRDRIYHKSYEPIKEKDVTLVQAKVKWKKDNKDIYKRKSSTAAVLCIRQKLLLMGMDFISKEEYDQNPTKYQIVDDTKYYEIYGKGDPISEPNILACVTSTGLPNSELKYVESNDISRRANMGELEHFRWVAYQISIGTIPMKFDDCIDRIKKSWDIDHFDPKKHQHVCLTTYDGLNKLRREQNKVIPGNKWNHYKNDKQLLDNLPAILKLNNQVIIQRIVDKKEVVDNK